MWHPSFRGLAAGLNSRRLIGFSDQIYQLVKNMLAVYLVMLLGALTQSTCDFSIGSASGFVIIIILTTSSTYYCRKNLWNESVTEYDTYWQIFKQTSMDGKCDMFNRYLGEKCKSADLCRCRFWVDHKRFVHEAIKHVNL